MDKKTVDTILNSLEQVIKSSFENNSDSLDIIENIYEESDLLDTSPNNIRPLLEKIHQSVREDNACELKKTIFDLRLILMDIENIYSEIIELIDNIEQKINDLEALEKENELVNLSLEELLEKNISGELGTFIYDLHENRIFNHNKLNHLCLLVKENTEYNARILNQIIKINSLMHKYIAYHLNKNDGYTIKNFNKYNEKSIYELFEVFDSDP